MCVSPNLKKPMPLLRRQRDSVKSRRTKLLKLRLNVKDLRKKQLLPKKKGFKSKQRKKKLKKLESKPSKLLKRLKRKD